MIKSIFQPKLAEILPKSIISDKQIQAAAKSLDLELEKMLSQVQLVLHLPRLDDLPEEVLEHLAYQYHCDFWRQDLPISAKRNQIRESIFWHRLKGTPVGVEKAISTFLVNAVVEENWQYGGEPYFFRITTKGLKYLTAEKDFIELINTAKNVRSWLEGIIFDLTIEQPHDLVHGIGEVETGLEVTEMPFADQSARQVLICGVGEIESGLEVLALVGGIEQPVQKLYHAVAEVERGTEVLQLKQTPPVNDYWLERYIAQKWRNWKINPILKHYAHNSEDILPPEPDIFPEGDFIRLYYYFPNKSMRYVTMLNPRDNLTAAEIKSAGLHGINALSNSKGYTSSAVIKALLVKKELWKIL